MISCRYFRKKYPFILLLLGLIQACTGQDISETESRTQFRELIRVPHTESRHSHSENIHANRENTITRVVRQSRDAIVTVTFLPRKPVSGVNLREGNALPGTPHTPTSRSGFFVSPEGYIVTKYRHNIDPGTDITIRTLGGSSHSAQIIGSDPFSGITLLKIEGSEGHDFVDFGNSDAVMPGEWSIALGIPEDESRMESQPSVSAGVINALDCMIEYSAFPEMIYPELIRTDAVISSSSEGGPMLNANGRVIGLNTYIPSGDGRHGTYGYGYAIPGNKVARVINHLADGDNLVLNYSVGLEMVPVTKKVAERYNLPAQQGLFVLGVNRDGPAFDGGILPGDVITSIGNDLIYGDTHAWAVLRHFEKGDLMPVTLLRGDDELETQILLRERLNEKDVD